MSFNNGIQRPQLLSGWISSMNTTKDDSIEEIYLLNIYINTNIGNVYIGNGLIHLHAIVLDQSQNNDLLNNHNMNKFNGNNSGSLLIQFYNLYKTSITLHMMDQIYKQFYKQNIQCNILTTQEVNSKSGISWQWLFGLCGVLVIISLLKAYHCGKITEILIYSGYSIPYELVSGKISHYNQYNNSSLVNHVSMDLYAYIFVMLGVLTKYYYSIRRQLSLPKESTCSFLSLLCVDTDYIKAYTNEIKSLCLIGNCKSCQLLDINGKSLNDTDLQICNNINITGINISCLIEWVYRMHNRWLILKILGQNETRYIRDGLNKYKICIDTKESDIIKQAIETFSTTAEIQCKDNNSNITLIIGSFEAISSIIYHFESGNKNEKYNDKICRLEVELIHEEKVNVSNVPLQLYYYENITLNHGDKVGYITTYACEPAEYYKLALSSRPDEPSSYYNLVLNPNNNIYRNKCNELIGSFSGSLIEYNNGNDVNIEYNLTIAKEEFKINTIKIGIVITLSLILLSSILCIITLMNTFYCSLYFSILWTYVCFTNERTKCLLEMKEHCQVLGFCGSYLSELYTLAAVYSHISKTRQISLKFVTNIISILIYTLNTVFVLSIILAVIIFGVLCVQDERGNINMSDNENDDLKIINHSVLIQQQQQQNDQFQKYISKINSLFEASCKDIKRIDESVLKSGIKLLFEAAYYCHDTFESVNTSIAILAIVFDATLF
eukprot:317457_1